MSDHDDQKQYLPAGSAADGPYALRIDPEQAGWGYSSLRVLELEPGGSHSLAAGDSEWIVLPLSGGCTVQTQGEIFELQGRESVFSGVTRLRLCTRAMPMHRSPPAREAASPWQERSASDDSPLATAPRRRYRSSCAARAAARARSTTSPRPTPSTATS